jgi:serine/threonine protein kinase
MERFWHERKRSAFTDPAFRQESAIDKWSPSSAIVWPEADGRRLIADSFPPVTIRPVATNSLNCPRCGTAVPAAARFCASCGYASTRLTTGQTLDGKYEILEKIGEGGMGEVYKARHLHLDEIRIIKVTKPDPLGEGPEPRRFQQEARLSTLVRHPNVAALYDFSRLPDGSYYMVWEFIDGITLEEWLRRHGPLPASRALDVAQQVLAGLAQIHAQGIVHRDLSPDNIMLREDKNGRLVAKIIDLGIAKRLAAETLQMTGTGMFLGKLKYCSPEQAGSLPSGATVDGRSDLYSFGVVLYEMLSGRPPFESETPEGYLGKHLHTPAPPLDTARLPAATGPALALIVRRALEKNRDRRFRDAEEFGAALARLRPPAAGPIENIPTAMTPPRHAAPYAWVLGAFLLIAIVAALSVVNRAGKHERLPGAPIVSSPALTARVSPTAAEDAVVVAPRILEDTPAPQAPRPTQSPASLSPSLPTPAPARLLLLASPTPPPLLLPNGQPLTEQRFRRQLDNWISRPIDLRSHDAVRLAYMARHWIGTHAGEPFAAELTQTFPKRLKEDADTAQSSGRPGLATQFLVAYLQLEPNDADALKRLTQLRERAKPPGQRQRRFSKD